MQWYVASWSKRTTLCRDKSHICNLHLLTYKYEMTMRNITICPYCGSEHLEWHNNGEKYYCLGCGNEFTEKEAEFEDVRHELSALIMETSEEEPFSCEVTIGEDEAQGLSTLQMPLVVGVFQDCDACIWVNIEGAEEPTNFDDLTLNDVKSILDDVKCYYKEDKK